MLHSRWFGHSKLSRKNANTRKAWLRLEPLEGRLTPATITVTSVSDAITVNGAVTLREAIASINAGSNINADVTASGAYGSNDKISFAISGTGVHTIKPTAALPAITHAVTISGYTQSGFTFNNSDVGDNAAMKIVLDGSSAGVNSNGLTIQANNCAILGLVIENFQNDGIDVKANNTTIQGNFIGTDATGKTAAGNSGAGIHLEGITNTIGGPLPLERNLISGNVTGIFNPGGSNQILNNIIGLDATGQKKLGNTLYGVHLASGGSTLGGTDAGTGNIISGNGGKGVIISGSFNQLFSNFIGTNANGDNLGNGDVGILFNGDASNNLIGGTVAGGNVIAFNCSAPPANNANAGIATDMNSTGLGNAFFGNLIYSNNGPPIDLGQNGLTPNDAEDADTGLNGLQNYPVLNVAAVQNTGSAISGTFNSTPNGSFRLEFFVNGSAGYAGLFLGAIQVYTDANGNAPVFFSTSKLLPIGTVSATATDSVGNTSEYSPPVAIKTTLNTTPGSDPNGFVSSVFLDLLHRLPDNGGLTFFVGQIKSGVPHSQVVLAVQNNSEYRGIVVTELFNRLLKRAPDPLAVLGFSNLLAQGSTVEQIESIIIGSVEYYQNRGSNNPSGFISAAFSDLLGRAPDNAAQIYFGTAIAEGVTRGAVAQQLVGSQEAAQFTVDKLFQKYLHRHADPGGKAYFGNLLTTGQVRDEQLAVMLINSMEYYPFV